ncbi:MAG: sulfurtransferase [Flavobacteriaceae bacterium]|nr:sulfurtransferase [Flavobacteriaceae bacterium]
MKPLVTVDWLSENLNEPNLVILNASLESNVANIEVEFPNLQIKGARYFDLKGRFSDPNNKLPNTLPNPEDFAMECRKLGINNNSNIVVYDNIGIYASPRVWWMFKSMGHENVSVLDGGLPDWINKENSTEKIQKQTIKEGDFKAKLHLEFQKNASEIAENIDNKEAIVVDARSEKRFYGLTPETRENLKSGHIPNSVNLPFLEVLRDGKFLTKEELLQVFKSKNLLNSPLIFTCGSGLTACILILASQLIQNKVNYLYDGSWTEWGQLEGVAIDK